MKPSFPPPTAASLAPLGDGLAALFPTNSLFWHPIEITVEWRDTRVRPIQKLVSQDSAMDDADVRDIQLTLQGDGDAYGRIVARYETEIGRQMWRFSRERATYEELVHDVFVEAYLSLPGYRGESPLLHWLRKIAVRVGYRHWKRRARLRASAPAPHQDWDQEVDPRAEELSDPEAGQRVHALLAQLPPRDRLILTLLYLDERNVEEAARLTGWSRTMVKVQAFRARRKFRKLFEEGDSP
ncbi:MAG: RNA polymerase sigma factor [Planctomycetes bacterium]|nr:RNA polymerase sigma factor [Planctomycetota bacterium]